MSHKVVPTSSMVIDASIARASGPPGSTHPVGAVCRNFLMAFRGVGHRAVFNGVVRAEWDKHQSKFAQAWLVSMFRMRKVRVVPDEPIDDLRDAIRDNFDDAGIVALLIKDVHLVEAALASDQRIASLDETARHHFGQATVFSNELAAIHWVNPTRESETVGDWLEAGMPQDPARCLHP